MWADRFVIHDDLGTAADLFAWFRAVDLAVPKALVTADALTQVQLLRDAFRRMAEFVTADERVRIRSRTATSVAIATVNERAQGSSCAPRLRLSRGRLTRADAKSGNPLDSAFAILATELIELVTSTDRDRLTACGGPGCVLYFMKDHSRRGWCGDACGNRARAARHYRLVKAANG
jgi:predicted RNA-binding Zn ribbon-like protein